MKTTLKIESKVGSGKIQVMIPFDLKKENKIAIEKYFPDTKKRLYIYRIILKRIEKLNVKPNQLDEKKNRIKECKKEIERIENKMLLEAI